MARNPQTMWMWAEACEALERAERLQRRFFHLLPLLAPRPTWEPPVDLYETAHDLWLSVALPGVDPAAVEIRFEAGVLIVSGERSLPAELRAAVIHRLEIPQGRFERRIELPSGRFELDRRRSAHGCLILGLRKLA